MLQVDIEAELDSLEVQGWQRSLALALAAGIDEKANASMASELRTLMQSLGSRATVKATTTVADEIKARREKRRAAQSRSAKSS
jgi:hypothetical protein